LQSVDRAVPKTILALMNVEGLTRENVASHLQKYRAYLKRLAGLPPSAPLPSSALPVLQQVAHRTARLALADTDPMWLAADRLTSSLQGHYGRHLLVHHSFDSAVQLEVPMVMHCHPGGDGCAAGAAGAAGSRQRLF
jgi:hypothetical protein